MNGFTIVDKKTLKIAHPRAHWRDRALVDKFHGKMFTKKQAEEFLLSECENRENSENTLAFVKKQTFNWLLKRGFIVRVL